MDFSFFLIINVSPTFNHKLQSKTLFLVPNNNKKNPISLSSVGWMNPRMSILHRLVSRFPKKKKEKENKNILVFLFFFHQGMQCNSWTLLYVLDYLEKCKTEILV